MTFDRFSSKFDGVKFSSISDQKETKGIRPKGTEGEPMFKPNDFNNNKLLQFSQLFGSF